MKSLLPRRTPGQNTPPPGQPWPSTLARRAADNPDTATPDAGTGPVDFTPNGVAADDYRSGCWQRQEDLDAEGANR